MNHFDRVASWLYRCLSYIFLGSWSIEVYNDPKSVKFVSDYHRLAVNSLRGFFDSVAAAIALYAFACLTGVIDFLIRPASKSATQAATYLKELQNLVSAGTVSLPEELKNIDLSGLIDSLSSGYHFTIHSCIAFTLLLVLFVDDYARSRMINFQAPCRSMGRFALDFFSVLFFGLALFYFSILGFNSSAGWFVLAASFFTRGVWSLKANLEAYIWESYYNQTSEDIELKEIRETLLRRDPQPCIPEGNMWGVHRLRVKRIGLYSVFYMLFSLVAWAEVEYGTFFILIEKGFNHFGAIELHHRSPAIIFYLIVAFLLLEATRFVFDGRAVNNSLQSGQSLNRENFASVMKTIIYMPPFIKRFLFKWIK